MRNLYLDNGATAFPKAPNVAESMCKYITEIGSNVGRGAYETSHEAEGVLFETRELICDLFHTDQPENVVFTKNITESLNVLIKGILREGDHVIVSSMEHNAVMRPLHSHMLKNIEITEVKCDTKGLINPEDIKANLKSNTKAVIMIHASNVCGTIMPAKEIGQICKENGVYFILDVAQTAGILDINFDELNVDALAFTGHKGLLGPQGIGGFVVTDQLAEEMGTFIEGGTGSKSDSVYQPDYMPDKFEAGTPNMPGIYGLHASLQFLKEKGLESIRKHELTLTQAFLEGLVTKDHVKIIGITNTKNRMAVVSIDFINEDNGIVGFTLDRQFGIKTRTGLHCAPNAHKTLGTIEQGTVRFSFGYFNTLDDVKYALEAIDKCKDL